MSNIANSPRKSANLRIARPICSYSSIFRHESWSCWVYNDYNGVWITAEHLCWHMITECDSVHIWAGTHKTREGNLPKNKIKAQQWHHWAKQFTTKHQNVERRGRNTEWFEKKQTKEHLQCISFLDYFPKWQNKAFFDNKCTCILVECAGMRWSTWVEKRHLFQNGCLHLEVWATRERCPFSPSPCLALQSPGLWWSGTHAKKQTKKTTTLTQQRHTQFYFFCYLIFLFNQSCICLKHERVPIL